MGKCTGRSVRDILGSMSVTESFSPPLGYGSSDQGMPSQWFSWLFVSVSKAWGSWVTSLISALNHG